jgi:hypothetical protein
MSTIGLVTVLESVLAERENRPAATAESVLDRTQLRSTGMTPSTRVRSSRINLLSSEASSLMMSLMVAVARRLLFVRMLRADMMLFEPAGFGIERTDIKSEWAASFLRRVLRRLIMVEVSGFRYDAASEASTSVAVLVSSDMALKSEPGAAERGACDLEAKESTEAIVERRLPLEGKARCTESGRGRNSTCSISTMDDESAVEATSESFVS